MSNSYIFETSGEIAKEARSPETAASGLTGSGRTGSGTTDESGTREVNVDSSTRGSSGKHCMSVCVNVHCSMNGADELVEHLVSNYGIAPDVPTEDGLSLELTYCFGACDMGPNVELDGEFTDGVTVERLDELLSSLNLERR